MDGIEQEISLWNMTLVPFPQFLVLKTVNFL